MKLRILSWSLLMSAAAWSQPAANSVNNAASARVGLTNPRVARGAWMSIRGRSLGPATAVYADAPSQQVGGTSVQIVSGGAQWDAPLIYASAGELLVRVPDEVPAGEAAVSIRAASGTAADAIRFTVVGSNFAVFTANRNDDAAAMFAQFRTGGFYYLNELEAPAKPGDEINLWGTGLGAEDAPVEILVNDRAAEVVAKTKGANGLDRVRIKIPEGGEGCGLPVFAKTGEAAAPVGMISVASDGRTCLDRGGFTADDVAKAQSAGGLKAGYLFLMRYGQPGGGGAFDIGFANFSRVSWDLLRGFRSNWSQNIPGACYAANTDSEMSFGGAGMPGADFFDDFYPFGETPLDAGGQIDVRGPGGPQQMQKAGDGLYFGMFLNMTNPVATFFTPGDYTLSGNGPGTGSFNATVKIGSPVTFGALPATGAEINRGQDYRITWTGGAPGDRVWVVGYSVELNGFQFARAGMVSCYALAQNGSLTIPSAALQFLPANSMPGMGFLMLYSSAQPQRFQPSGGGLDAGYLMSLSYSAAPASFR